jgi:hypothetical protein
VPLTFIDELGTPEPGRKVPPAIAVFPTVPTPADVAKDVGAKVGKKLGADFCSSFEIDPKKKLNDMNKGRQREAGKEYRQLIDESDKTRKEAAIPYYEKVAELFRRAAAALAGDTPEPAPKTEPRRGGPLPQYPNQ